MKSSMRYSSRDQGWLPKITPLSAVVDINPSRPPSSRHPTSTINSTTTETMTSIFSLVKSTETSQALFTHPERFSTKVVKALRSLAEQHPTEFVVCSVMITAGFAIIIVPLALGFGEHGPTSGELRDSNNRF